KREANVYCTDQVLGLGPVRVRFGSRTVLQTVLQPPTRIDVTSKDYPFQQFKLSWNFAGRSELPCKSHCRVRTTLFRASGYPGSSAASRYRRHHCGAQNTCPQPI